MKTKLSKLFSLLIFVLLFAAGAQSQTNVNSNKNDKNNEKQEKAKKSKNPNETEGCPESGTVKLRVVFDKSGKVTKAEIVSSGGCKNFDKQALEAAKKIKFEPAKKNGEKITVVKLVEYKFTIY